MARYGKTMQRNWIGRSEGWKLRLMWRIPQKSCGLYHPAQILSMGVSYLGIAAAHPLAELAAEKILNWLEFIR